MSPIPYVFLSLFFLYALLRRKRANPNALPPPPGPRGLPLVGWLISLPPGKRWLVFDAWLKQYGDIVSFKILGRNFVLLGSSRRTDDVFGKRSHNYSDREALPFLIDVVDYGFNFSLLPYGPVWRKRRRLFQNHFSPASIKDHNPIQLKETRVLLRNLLASPAQFNHHLRLCSASIISSVAYGNRIQGLDDPYIVKADEVIASTLEGGISGRFWVDYVPFVIPFMRYVPNWVPGAGYKIQAEKWKASGKFVESSAFEAVKRDSKNGIDRPCITTRLLEAIEDEVEGAETEADARSVVATVYIGGADTTLSSISNFFYAMAVYPEIQKKAQAEIDRVVGLDRLPNFIDKESLPYIVALMKEVTRWQLVVPSISHVSAQDDEYDGYFIPKGTIVIGNTWSILHDPEVYPDPEGFRPERFLRDGDKAPCPDPVQVFGYGRRICPGRFFGEDSLFIIIASVLATFDILSSKDEHGNPINIEVEYLDGLSSQPSEFQCIIKPRSSASVALVRASELEFE